MSLFIYLNALTKHDQLLTLGTRNTPLKCIDLINILKHFVDGILSTGKVAIGNEDIHPWNNTFRNICLILLPVQKRKA